MSSTRHAIGGLRLDRIDELSGPAVDPWYLLPELRDGRWAPTFANAKYPMARREFDDWNPETRTLPALPLQGKCFGGCIRPVIDSGQAVSFAVVKID